LIGVPFTLSVVCSCCFYSRWGSLHSSYICSLYAG